MRFLAVFLFCAFAELALAQDAPPTPEPSPHWAEFETPHTATFYGLTVRLPPGFRLCGIADSYSNLEWYYVPLDANQRCEQLSLPIAWEKFPDFVVIAPYIDTPGNVETLDDYVQRERFFCHGMSYGSSDSPRQSNAPTSITRVGKALAGLNTVACSREDATTGRYSTALLAYQPKPGDSGHGYTIGAYVHQQNKPKADHMVREIAKLLKVLKLRDR